MINFILFILLGFGIGIVSGLTGIGGGIILVPALVLLLGFSQHQAQGTTLALMVPPIGLLAAWTYYKQGFVDVKIAALVCIGFFIGGLVGAKIAIIAPNELLKKIFAVILVVVAVKMILNR